MTKYFKMVFELLGVIIVCLSAIGILLNVLYAVSF